MGDRADGCRFIFLDVGSNIGVQIRKLFEPELYPKANILRHFEESFGSPEFRRSEDSDVCAFGFEANPQHFKRLKSLEACYKQKGWRVHFFLGAAGTADGTISFFGDGNGKLLEWAASIYDFTKGKRESVVPVYDLAHFVKQLDARKWATTDSKDIYVSGQPAHPSYVYMKMDIELSEYTVLPHMITEQVLCSNFINVIGIEWHNPKNGGPENELDFRVLYKHFHTFHNLTHGDCERTKVIKIDDETYLFDSDIDLPLLGKTRGKPNKLPCT